MTDKRKVTALADALALVRLLADEADKAAEPARTADLANLKSAERALEVVVRDREYRGRK